MADLGIPLGPEATDWKVLQPGTGLGHLCIVFGFMWLRFESSLRFAAR